MQKSAKWLFLICFILSTESYCQEIEFGIRGGLNVATLGTGETEFQPRIGFQAGFYLTKTLIENFSAKAEILYSLQGAQNDFVPEIKNNYYYVNMPVLLAYSPQKELSFEAGIQPGYLVKAIAKDPVISKNIRSELNHFDLGIVMGFAYHSFLNFSIRYTAGLINTTDASPVSEIKFKNKVLLVSISRYLFRKSKESSTPL